MLFIHSDHFEYEVKKRTKFAEEIPDEKKYGRMDDALVVFIAVERRDEGSEEKVAERAEEEIEKVCAQVKSERVVLYPYAHLSSLLSKTETAVETLARLEHALREKGFEVLRSPFGWYKSFKISCKGHPLSELSREIDISKDVTRDDVVKEIESDYYILTPEGEEIELDLESIDDLEILEKDESLKKFILSEELKRIPSEEPPSIKVMQRLELVDYEDASDSGHFRFYPKGELIFNLLKNWARYIALERLKAIEIETPIIYDWGQKDIQEQGRSFHERHYVINADEKKFVLRFAGDFGLFRMMKNATVSYRQLPLRVYEFSKSFRYERHGELTGLKRLRAFHMPDIHSFAKDLEQGWEEYKEIYRHLDDLARGINIEYAIAFRVVKDFYDEYKTRIVELLKYSNRPALIEVLSERKHYWVVKHEFQGIDSVNGSCQLSTVQLDVEDAERYSLNYTDKDGEKKPYIICHASIGSIERWIYEILEDALKKEKPELPFWLSPTQIRLVPVSNEFLGDCVKIADFINARVDIDDREEKVSRKIRDAEREWINMIIVYGAKERESNTLPVRLRNGELRELTLDELNELVKRLQGEYPFEPLSLPSLLSRRIVFRG